VRDLQRGQATGLPSGEAIARALGVEALTLHEVGLAERGWRGETPLWLYILREADAKAGGSRLGPVGGRIVGEVLLGIVDAEPESFGRRSRVAAEPARHARGQLRARRPAARIGDLTASGRLR
jgi:hypothetical protein